MIVVKGWPLHEEALSASDGLLRDGVQLGESSVSFGKETHMDATGKNTESRPTKMTYQSPAMKKHEPVRILQGSALDDCLWSLYYSSLYYSY